MSATLTVDPKKYSRLANRIVMKAIESEGEYDRMVAARRAPDGQRRGSILIQAYDIRHDPLPPLTPGQMLAYMMESSGRLTNGLLPVFGARGRVSEVLSGKRSIVKDQAKKLATLLRVSAGLFI